MASARFGDTSLVGGSLALVGGPAALTMLVGATVAIGAPNAKYADTALLGVTTANVTQSAADTNLVGVTVAYTVGAPQVFTSRSWGFTYDGHPFYVNHLGQEGTFVYDLSTKQWAQWQTQGYDTWNMEQGVTWNNYIVGGSLVDGSLWKLDDDAFVDEGFRAIERVVTGGIPMRARRAMSNYAVNLSGSTGDIDDDSDSSISLEVSDDNGKTWIDVGAVDLQPAVNNQEIAWLSLGTITAPGRIFKFSDTGSLRRIDDAEAKIEGEDDNEQPNADNK